MEQLANVTVSQCHIIKIITSSLNFTDKTELLEFEKKSRQNKMGNVLQHDCARNGMFLHRNKINAATSILIFQMIANLRTAGPNSPAVNQSRSCTYNEVSRHINVSYSQGNLFR